MSLPHAISLQAEKRLWGFSLSVHVDDKYARQMAAISEIDPVFLEKIRDLI